MSYNSISERHTPYIYYSVIALLCFCAIISCTGSHSFPNDLAAADSLCRTKPDSAMAQLERMQDKYAHCSDDYNRNYYLLLKVKSANNAYKPLADSTIFRVMDFYENANDKAKLCQTYYYVGKHFVQENDAPQALQYFQKALDLVDNNTPIYFRSCIYSQSAQLFEKQGLHPDALQMYKRSYQCDSLLNDTVNIIYSLMDIAMSYNFQKRYKDGVATLEKAYALSKGIDNIVMQKSLTQSMAAAYYFVDDMNSAKRYLGMTMKDIIPEIESPAYAIAIDIYNKDHQVDSVVYFSNLLINNGTIYARRKAAKNLMDYYNSKHDVQQTAKYLNLCIAFTDSVNKIKAIDKVADMHYTYNYKLREKENTLLKSQATVNRLILVSIVLSGAFIIMLCIYFMQKNKVKLLKYIHLNEQLDMLRAEAIRNGEKEVQKKDEELSVLQDEISRLTEQHNSEKARNEELEKLAEKLKQTVTDNHDQVCNAALSSKAVVDVYTLIKDRLDNKKNLNDADWERLEEAVNIAYPNFKGKLYSLHTFKDDEYKICMLIKIGFMNSDISTIMSKTDSAITQKRSKMYTIIFSSKGNPKDFNNFIKNL